MGFRKTILMPFALIHESNIQMSGALSQDIMFVSEKHVYKLLWWEKTVL